MDDQLVAELRTFILSFGEHDPDCRGRDATTWEAQRSVCTCGFLERLDELMAKLQKRLEGGVTR